MVVAPAGSFMMGSPWWEVFRWPDEGPVHEVTIAHPFAVGVCQVTFEEWDACVSGGGCGGYRPDDAGWGRGRRPVINVSWEDAQRYVEWLSRKTGEGYRLLDVSGWDRAARAGTGTGCFWWGDLGDRERMNGGGIFTAEGRTTPVGSFPANAFGLHDVHGNVWEWVENCCNDSYRGAPSDGSAWKSGDCGLRIVRGGSWLEHWPDLRSARRQGVPSGGRGDNAGFRMARTLAP